MPSGARARAGSRRGVVPRAFSRGRSFPSFRLAYPARLSVPHKIRLVFDVHTIFHNCRVFNTEGSAIFRMARTLADHFMAAVYARAWPFLRHVERSSLNAAIRRCDQYEKDVRAWSAARARGVKRSKARPEWPAPVELPQPPRPPPRHRRN